MDSSRLLGGPKAGGVGGARSRAPAADTSRGAAGGRLAPTAPLRRQTQRPRGCAGGAEARAPPAREDTPAPSSGGPRRPRARSARLPRTYRSRDAEPQTGEELAPRSRDGSSSLAGPARLGRGSGRGGAPGRRGIPPPRGFAHMRRTCGRRGRRAPPAGPPLPGTRKRSRGRQNSL